VSHISARWIDYERTSDVEFQSVVVDFTVVLDINRPGHYRILLLLISTASIRLIKWSLTSDTLKALVQAFVHCRLEYFAAMRYWQEQQIVSSVESV